MTNISVKILGIDKEGDMESLEVVYDKSINSVLVFIGQEYAMKVPIQDFLDAIKTMQRHFKEPGITKKHLAEITAKTFEKNGFPDQKEMSDDVEGDGSDDNETD